MASHSRQSLRRIRRTKNPANRGLHRLLNGQEASGECHETRGGVAHLRGLVEMPPDVGCRRLALSRAAATREAAVGLGRVRGCLEVVRGGACSVEATRGRLEVPTAMSAGSWVGRRGGMHDSGGRHAAGARLCSTVSGLAGTRGRGRRGGGCVLLRWVADRCRPAGSLQRGGCGGA